jgi:hypothetical protein
VKIALRTACSEDFVFARNLYFETMRGMIERLFGWDQTREERNFAGFFKVEEVRIIADGQDVGWIHRQEFKRRWVEPGAVVGPAAKERSRIIFVWTCGDGSATEVSELGTSSGGYEWTIVYPPCSFAFKWNISS